MSLTTFEKLLPWSGARRRPVLGRAGRLREHVLQGHTGRSDHRVIRDHLGLNYASQGCLVADGDRPAVLRDGGPQSAALG